METLVLPYLQSDDSVELAMQQMKAYDSRAVVINIAGRTEPPIFRLSMNRAIIQAWHDHAVMSGELANYECQDVAAIPMDEAVPQAGSLFLMFETLLDNKKAALAAFVPSVRYEQTGILLFTRHEGGGLPIARAQKYCVCRQNRHLTECPPAVQDGNCLYCGSQYDCY